MTIDEIKQRKTALGLTNEMIAQASGIPLSTIQKIISGSTKAPRKASLEAIEAVLYAEELRRKKPVQVPASGNTGISYNLPGAPSAGMVREPSAAYTLPDPSSRKRDGYTLEDYYALPDERRVELIDGVFYDMAAPTVIHQKILGELHLLFRECADSHENQCEVFLSPCDVRLDCDDRTMVQPDLLVMCHPYDIGAKAFQGAPDLTLEILSPSTRAKDMLLKLYKYQNAGVREYWIVDPEKKAVLVYNLAEGNYYPEKYDFDAIIPIHISDGSCSIDFSRVHNALKKAGAS